MHLFWCSRNSANKMKNFEKFVPYIKQTLTTFVSVVNKNTGKMDLYYLRDAEHDETSLTAVGQLKVPKPESWTPKTRLN